MFPEFVSLDKNIVYFFPGKDRKGRKLYGDLEITSKISYTKEILEDKAIIFRFSQNIKKITCVLKPIDSNLPDKEISISI